MRKAEPWAQHSHVDRMMRYIIEWVLRMEYYNVYGGRSPMWSSAIGNTCLSLKQCPSSGCTGSMCSGCEESCNFRGRIPQSVLPVHSAIHTAWCMKWLWTANTSSAWTFHAYAHMTEHSFRYSSTINCSHMAATQILYFCIPICGSTSALVRCPVHFHRISYMWLQTTLM